MAETDEPQDSAPLTIPQLPFDDFNVKPEPEEVAVIVAQVPVVYHVPPEMMHPCWLPEVTTLRKPEPLKPPVEVGLGPDEVVVLVDVGVAPPVFGKYLMPLLGHVPVLPTTSVAM